MEFHLYYSEIPFMSENTQSRFQSESMSKFVLDRC